MNPIAKELNNNINENNSNVFDMLSDLGKQLFFPKGILSQSAEAKKNATKYNATIGISKENNKPMHLSSLMDYFSKLNISEITPYSPSYGKPELRKKWQDFIYKKNPGLDENTKISLPIVTNGITHGLSTIADMFVNPGDVIILPDKIWGNYKLTFLVRKQAEFEQFTFFEGNSFNMKAFEQKILEVKQKTNKIILLLNFPNNPIGYTPTINEAKQISEILLKTANENCNLITIIDDAYFGLVYEENIFKESLFSLLAGKNKNLLAIKLDAATKEDYVWGFRTGFITYSIKSDSNVELVYDALEKKTGGCIRGNISNCSSVAQSILIKIYSDENYEKYKLEKYNILKERAVIIKKILSENNFEDEFTAYPFNSGYFMCVKLKNYNSEDFRQFLLKNYGIGVIAPNNTDIRIAFSSVDKDDLEDLFKTMYKALKDFKQI